MLSPLGYTNTVVDSVNTAGSISVIEVEMAQLFTSVIFTSYVPAVNPVWSSSLITSPLPSADAQVYVYAGKPFVIVKSIDPSAKPLQDILSPLGYTTTVVDSVNSVGSESVYDWIIWQPLASVAVIVYVPTVSAVWSSSFTIKPLPSRVDHTYV